jgi:hypothetical protein
MLLKNFWLYSRNLKMTLCQIFMPVIACIILFILSKVGDKFKYFETPNPIVKNLPILPHCRGDPHCVTLGYSIIVITNAEFIGRPR